MQYPKLFSIAAICTVAASAVFISVLGAAAPAKPKPLSSYDPQVKAVLAKMTLEEKVGQMTQPDQEALKDESDIESLFLGSVLSGGSSDPKEGNSLEAWTNLYDKYQKRALKTRLAIPLIYGVDALHGHNNVIGAVVFPQNIGLGCTRNPALVEKIARVTAEEVRATGIQWTFAPCVTVPQDIRWGRTYEGFSDDPKVVKELGEAAVRGLQGPDLSNPLSLLACAKHYIGDGGTTFGTGMAGKSPLDQGDTRVDEPTLRRLHLQGYLTTIAAGAGTVMPSYSSWNGVKCSASKQLMTDILKGELGFQGFIISDYNAIDQITPDYKKAIEISINAGMDMVMVTERYREYVKDLKELVKEGRVPMSRIDDAVTRILRVKFAMGLMDKNRSQLADRNLHKTFGSAEHRMVARDAVRQSLVLLKNEKKTLPLKKTVARIHIAGKNADDIGNQCGGWTIDWQGKSGNITTGGTTIRAAIQAAVAKGTQVTYSADGSGAQGATVGVVVIGEKPYAEMMGDRKTLALDAADVAAVKNMKAAGIPVVVVLLSGRPLIINDVLAQADAFVAAWLPGTEGQGVSDVLFGDYKPTGKLAFAWPRSDEQLPLGTATTADVLFKNGFGLKY
ncbi:glycoside hydrolase family 3 protein [Paludibaculum fermentans]|uniref:beta-glucosidase n=1 Tax=Paludibaculum fermentans TaxID=1473598 RepID=A0A7S7NMN4_PALFE|nr:glycoside hydrolase family 3 N-terminal domain-containing protein [Paludibaculum fermentans]QOY86355.1 glycoside hydrolase family 3 C-terminal domain-containing protein [Paludibaculum fermentans]